MLALKVRGLAELRGPSPFEGAHLVFGSSDSSAGLYGLGAPVVSGPSDTPIAVIPGCIRLKLSCTQRVARFCAPQLELLGTPSLPRPDEHYLIMATLIGFVFQQDEVTLTIADHSNKRALAECAEWILRNVLLIQYHGIVRSTFNTTGSGQPHAAICFRAAPASIALPTSVAAAATGATTSSPPTTKFGGVADGPAPAPASSSVGAATGVGRGRRWRNGRSSSAPVPASGGAAAVGWHVVARGGGVGGRDGAGGQGGGRGRGVGGALTLPAAPRYALIHTTSRAMHERSRADQLAGEMWVGHLMPSCFNDLWIRPSCLSISDTTPAITTDFGPLTSADAFRELFIGAVWTFLWKNGEHDQDPPEAVDEDSPEVDS